MRFYKTLNRIALVGALLLSVTRVEAMDAEDKGTLFPGLPSSIFIRILAHASEDSETNVGPIAAKYRLVCKNWKNAADRESRNTVVGLLEKKSPFLRSKEQLLHVRSWHADGDEETDAVKEARIKFIESALITKSPLKLIRITTIWGEPDVLPRPHGFRGPDTILFGIGDLKRRNIIAVIRANVTP